MKNRAWERYRRFGTAHAVVAYIAFACVLTWPLVAHFSTAVIGDLESDVWKHLWGFWWMRQSLATDHVLPLYTWLLNYPYGGSLFFIDPLGGTLAIPLQSFMGPVAAYNAMVLFNIVLACSGAFRLARYLTHSAPASFVAGVIYGCSPYLMSNITSGISESFNVGWIPFFVLYYTRALREPARANLWKAGVFLGLATIGCWYYGVFCAVYACFFFVVEVVRRARAARAELEGGGPAPSLLARARPWVATGLALTGLEMLRSAMDALATGGEVWPKAVISLATLVLLSALLAQARRDEPSPPTRRRVALRFGAQAAVVFSVWCLVLVLRFETADEELAWGRLLLGVVSLSALWTSLDFWRRLADARLAARLRAPCRLLGRLCATLAALLILSATASQILHPPDDPDARATRFGVVGIGWLLALWAAWRARAPLSAAFGEAWQARRRPSADARRRRVVGAALLAVAIVYLAVPPAPVAVVLLQWGAVFAVLLAIVSGLEGGGAIVAGARLALAGALDDEGEGLAFARHVYETVFKRALIVAVVSLAIIVPVAWCFRHTLNSDVSLVYRMRNKQNVDFYLSEKFHNVSRLVDYVVPGKSRAVRTYTVDRLTRVSYVGWIVLCLSLWAVLRVRRREVRWWTGVALAAVTFSLGPFLYVTSDIHLTGRFPLYMWMYDWFPFFSQVSIPFRFNTVAMLALAVLSAFTLASVLRRRSVGERALLATVVSLAVLIEVMYVSPAPFPMPLASAEAPPILARLAAESGPCGLLDIPVQRYEGELLPGEYFFYQMVHRKYIPNRVEGEIPLFVYRNRFMLQLFHLEHDWTGYPNESEKVLRKSLDELRAFNFRYIVVHENLLRAGAGERVRRMLEGFIGPPRHRQDGITVYDVQSAAPVSR